MARGDRRASLRIELPDLLVEERERLLERLASGGRARRFDLLEDASPRELEAAALLSDLPLLRCECLSALRARTGILDLGFDGLALPAAGHGKEDPKASFPCQRERLPALGAPRACGCRGKFFTVASLGIRAHWRQNR